MDPPSDANRTTLLHMDSSTCSGFRQCQYQLYLGDDHAVSPSYLQIRLYHQYMLVASAVSICGIDGLVCRFLSMSNLLILSILSKLSS